MRPIQDSAPPYKALFHPSLDAGLAAAWLAEPCALLPKSSRAPWRGLSACGELFIKYREAGRLESLRPIGSDRFSGALSLGLELEARQLPASSPLALIEGPGPQGGRGRWLIMSAIPGLSLAQFVAQSSLGASVEVFGRLAGILGRFHDCGFRQRDLKAPNIMVADGGELVLVDLEGMHALDGPADWKLRAKDLGRLGASFLSPTFVEAGVGPGHWDELLRLYLGACDEPAWNAGKLSKRTLGYALKKVERNAAAGRPLA
ncbi:MAG: hypothetical protein ACI9C2_001374 [Gammaproteobacteria bacterium]|jgi:hypothetical protein